MTEDTASEAFRSALTALEEACDRASQAVQGMATGQDAFSFATQLADALRERAEDAANLRAVTAARIAEEEKLSLAGLADSISISKARAGQLIQTAKKVAQKNLPEGERDA